MKPSRKELKMVLLKSSINYMVPRLVGRLDVKDPQTPQGQLLARVWSRLETVMDRESRLDFGRDNNFGKLMETVKRALLFLTEEDPYYSRWLGLLFLTMSEELERSRKTYSFEDALKTGARPQFLTYSEFEKHRGPLFDLFLCGPLKALELMSDADLERIRRAKLEGHAVDVDGPGQLEFFRFYFNSSDRWENE